MTRCSLALVGLVAMCLPRVALAQDEASPAEAADEPTDDAPATELPAPTTEAPAGDPPPAEIEEDFDPSRDHFEATLGIIGGFADYTGSSFAYEKGGAPVQLQGPFDGAPYDGTAVVGMRIELRYVATHVRTTLGVELPFPSFTQDDTTSTPLVAGMPTTVSVQKLSHTTFHFGFGGELSFGPVTPFVDVLGSFHFLSTRLAVGDQFGTYGTTTFGIGARGGARIALKKSFFLHASGTGGFLGPTKFIGELGLGFAI